MVRDESIFILHNYSGEAGGILSDKPNGIATGQNSGYQAVNIAYLAGASRIVLLGFDARSDGRRMHWFGDHPLPTPPAWLSVLPTVFKRLAPVIRAKGVEVINCSPGSAIDCFRRDDVARVLDDPQPAALPG